MADTLPNVQLPKDTWVDIYAATGIPVGTKIIVENLGSAPVMLVSVATEPASLYPSGYQFCHQRQEKINDDGDSGAWAKTTEILGLINVQVAS